MKDDTSSWHLLTGEYPPQLGGIADYSRLVARGLSDAGAEVHVWTSSSSPKSVETESDSGVRVHRDAGTWSRADLHAMGRALDRQRGPRRLLLQFAPNAFSRKGLNLNLGRWLIDRHRRGDQIHLMFHEVTYIPKSGDSVARRLLAFVQRRIVARLLHAADQVDIAIPYWKPMLRPLDPIRGRVYQWRPVPSNVPVVDDPAGVASIRSAFLASSRSTLLGSFGTYASDVVQLLTSTAVPVLLTRRDLSMVLIGRGGESVVEKWVGDHPSLGGRVVATGGCEAGRLSRVLQACDVLLQPYPGGVCTKRGSLMAGIAHGVAIVTTMADASEPIWMETKAVGLAPEGDAPALIRIVLDLVDDPRRREEQGRAGFDLYEQQFALRHTIEALLGSPGVFRS